MSAEQPEEIAFTLTCAECDAGQEISSQAEAEAAGWSEIRYVPELSMANYLGLCPACRQWFEVQDGS